MLGGALAAGASLIGGLLGSKSSKKQAQQDAAANYAAQKEFAQKGIRWKVNDAKAAGLHPLYALGAPTTSFAPSFSGGDGGSALQAGIADFGQNLGRAIESTRTPRERAEAKRPVQTKMQMAADMYSLENMRLQNDLLSSQIARIQADQVGPPGPSAAPLRMGSIDGQADAVRVDPLPAQPVINSRYDLGREAGHITDTGHMIDSNGVAQVVRSADATQRLEEDAIGMLDWNFRNRVLPFFTGRPPTRAPDIAPRRYHRWFWNGGAWVQRPIRKTRRTWQ